MRKFAIVVGLRGLAAVSLATGIQGKRVGRQVSYNLHQREPLFFRPEASAWKA